MRGVALGSGSVIARLGAGSSQSVGCTQEWLAGRASRWKVTSSFIAGAAEEGGAWDRVLPCRCLEPTQGVTEKSQKVQGDPWDGSQRSLSVQG